MIASLFAATLVRILNEVAAYQAPTAHTLSIVDSAYSFLVTANPIILIILGVVVFFAGKLARFVGAVMVILGAILLALPYL
ncbi:hypothetical protein [[Eubacterium] cellulosolvens]